MIWVAWAWILFIKSSSLKGSPAEGSIRMTIFLLFVGLLISTLNDFYQYSSRKFEALLDLVELEGAKNKGD